MSFLKVIGVLIIDVSKVWVPLRGYMSVQAMYAAPIVLHRKSSKRQNFSHMAFLKRQNSKASLYKLPKNH